MKIELHVANLGPVPSFKNNKRSIKLKNGSTMIVTDRKTKKWMQRVTENFVSLLSFATPTTGGATLTAQQRLSLIVSSMPQDDSRQWISRLAVCDQQVKKGEEGCVITIEPI